MQDLWIYSLHALSGQYFFQLLIKGRAQLSFLQRLLALTGALTLKTVFIHPIWVAHIHYLYVRSGNVPIFNSTLHAFKVILHTSPLFLLAGIGEVIVPSVLLGLIQYVTFEAFKKLPLTPMQRHLAEPIRAAVVEIALSPLRAVINAAICSTPFFSDPAYQRYPTGTLPIIRHIYKNYGIKGFYRGYIPSLIHKGASWAISSLILALPFRHHLTENAISIAIVITSLIMDRKVAARNGVPGDLHGDSTAQLLAHLTAHPRILTLGNASKSRLKREST